MLWLLVTAVAAGGGFFATRNFVKRRLRYVDAIQKPAAPLIAGAVAMAVALPVAALPIITVTTAVLVGAGVAAGVASGRRDRSGA